jgi:glutathione S-transferase
MAELTLTTFDWVPKTPRGYVWLAGSFSVADILMADVQRLVDRFDGLEGYAVCRDYLARATARPAFAKAYADLMPHFAAADCAPAPL